MSIRVALSLYWSGDFGHVADQWVQLGDLLSQTFGWPSLEYIGVLAREGRIVGDRPRSDAQLIRVVSASTQRRYFEISLATERPDEHVASESLRYVAIRDNFRSVSWRNMPPLQLPFDLSTTTEVDESWPTAPQRQALLRVRQLLAATSGVVFVGTDRWEAENEKGLSSITPWPSDAPMLWKAGILEKASRRHTFGDSARGTYWGSVLSDRLVARIGGIEVLRDTGAFSIDRQADDSVYVQLTETAADALLPDGQARLARLEAALAPAMQSVAR